MGSGSGVRGRGPESGAGVEVGVEIGTGGRGTGDLSRGPRVGSGSGLGTGIDTGTRTVRDAGGRRVETRNHGRRCPRRDTVARYVRTGDGSNEPLTSTGL